MRRSLALVLIVALAIGLWSLRDPSVQPAGYSSTWEEGAIVAQAPSSAPSSTVTPIPPGVMAAEARLNPEVTTTTTPPPASTVAPAPTTPSPTTTSARPPSPTPTTTKPQRVAGLDAAFASQLVAATNQARAAAGLSALKVSGTLTGWAKSWSEQMAGSGALGHSNFSSLLGQFSAVAENVARGYPTAAATSDAWMASSGHRANILNPTYTSIGIGVWIDADGVSWATQVFGG